MFFYLFIVIMLCSCASQSYLTGGPEDNSPPELIKVTPPPNSLNVKPEKINFYFNEFITLNNLQQKLIISPPILNYKVKHNLKKFSLIIKDTLQDNTTYTFFFDDAIRDFTEDNAIQNFTYCFSTGNVLDTIKLSGKIYDAFNLKPEQNFIIGLYKDTTDSVIIKHRPYYLTRSDKNGSFRFLNIKKGKYKIAAFDDKDKDYKWNPFTEKIAFLINPIEVDNKTSEVKLYSFLEPRSKIYITNLKFIDSSLIEFEFNTYLYDIPEVSIKNLSPDSLKVIFEKPLKKGKIYLLSKYNKKDTLNILFTYKILDSLNNKVNTTEFKRIVYQNITTKKTKEKIKFSIQNNSTIKIFDTINVIIPFNNNYSINFELFELKDTTWEPMRNIKYEVDSTNFLKHSILPCFNDEKKYKLITKYKSKTDTLIDSLFFSTYEKEYYSTLLLNFNPQNKDKNYIIQLIKNDKTPIKEWYAKGDTVIKDNLSPGEYFFKVIEDNNANKKWDNGFYFKNLLPEKVIIFDNPVKLRSNWELEYQLSIE